MSLITWFLDKIDSPRFCVDCGEPITVEDKAEFDSKTGKIKARWIWHCPKVRMDLHERGLHVQQWGTDVIHPYGVGRPRWHLLLNENKE